MRRWDDGGRRVLFAVEGRAVRGTPWEVDGLRAVRGVVSARGVASTRGECGEYGDKRCEVAGMAPCITPSSLGRPPRDGGRCVGGGGREDGGLWGVYCYSTTTPFWRRTMRYPDSAC